MRSDDMRNLGIALAERVRREVDTVERLERIIKLRRRGRRLVVASTVTLLIIIAAVMLTVSPTETPVVNDATTTIPATLEDLQSLPVQVTVVLADDYTVDESGVCRGSGPLAGIETGSGLVVTKPTGAPDAATTVVPLLNGREVTEASGAASVLFRRGETAVCAFTLSPLGYDIREYAEIAFFPEGDPNIASSMTISGQRVVVRFMTDPAAEVAPTNGTGADS